MHCLGGVAEYRCGNIEQLPVHAAINDTVTPYSQDIPTSPTHHPPVDPYEEDLDALEKGDFLQMIRSLRRELVST